MFVSRMQDNQAGGDQVKAALLKAGGNFQTLPHSFMK
jgi:hypothetical protein